jgi:hypothetical protein
LKQTIKRLVVASAYAVALGVPVQVLAQDGFGVRAGVSADPDQFYFGGHWISEPLIERLRFQPNVEVGVGDDLTLVAFNFELAYWIPLERSPWNLYVGGGPALNLYSFDDDDRPGDDDSELEGGVNVLFGLAHRQGLSFEFKVGVADSPDIKVGVTYTFR